MKRLVQTYRLKTMWAPWVAAFLCSVSSVYFAVALCTYHDHDPSWLYHSTQDLPVHNKAGIVGAHLAALCIYLFGSASFLLIPLLAFWAYLFLQGSSWYQEMDRSIASCLIIIISAGLAAHFLVESSGGAIGYILVNILYSIFDSMIVTVGLCIGLYASLVVFSRMEVLLYMITLCRYLCSPAFLAPVCRLCKKIATLLMQSGRYIATCFHELVTLHNRGETIVQEDFESMVKEELGHVIKDPFWDTLFKQEDVKIIETDQSKQQEEKVSVTSPHTTENLQSPAVKQPYRLPEHIFVSAKKYDQDIRREQEDEQRVHILEEKLSRFGIDGSVVSIKKGPVVTLFEYKPTIDTKLSKILALEDDLALALQALSIRILAPIPGTSVVGFEVANTKRLPVTLSSIIHASEFKKSKAHLPLVLGVDTIGNPVVVDLATMPHLLVAGATGSGKSVGLNAMLVSLLYALRPDQMKLILIDPKRLEFACYHDIAHLSVPIITESKDVIPVLRWVVHTMEERYRMMARIGVRNIFDYHQKLTSDRSLEQMPFMVVVIDELSDLMMTTGKEVEELIARIAQMARAAGIHMIVATQRPSVDVITGLIKVNFPSRIAFRVTSKVDSRTILDTMGAEKLLGKGDMLFLHAHALLQRIHGAYVSDNQIDELANFIRSQQPAVYQDIETDVAPMIDVMSQEDDQLYKEVINFLKTVDEISISLLQRRFRIGYNRSARIMELLEYNGCILPNDGSKMRKVVHDSI
jgi:DNA segregation ATPase FtsK/SpoIIIE, S-DNA-T family